MRYAVSAAGENQIPVSHAGDNPHGVAFNTFPAGYVGVDVRFKLGFKQKVITERINNEHQYDTYDDFFHRSAPFIIPPTFIISCGRINVNEWMAAYKKSKNYEIIVVNSADLLYNRESNGRSDWTCRQSSTKEFS